MATRDDIRRLALALPETTEQDHHGFPSFRVKGKIFCTLRLTHPLMMLKLDPEDQHNLTGGEPETFEPVPGGWGRRGSTFVKYERLDQAKLAGLLKLAWIRAAPKRLSEVAFPTG